MKANLLFLSCLSCGSGICNVEEGTLIGHTKSGVSVYSLMSTPAPPIEEIDVAIGLVAAKYKGNIEWEDLTITWHDGKIDCSGQQAFGCFRPRSCGVYIDLHQPRYKTCTPISSLIHELLHVAAYKSQQPRGHNWEALEKETDNEFRDLYPCVQEFHRSMGR
jgi:hypothetical protein